MFKQCRQASLTNNCQTLNEDVDVTDVSETQYNKDYQWEITTSTQVHKVRTSCWHGRVLPQVQGGLQLNQIN